MANSIQSGDQVSVQQEGSEAHSSHVYHGASEGTAENYAPAEVPKTSVSSVSAAQGSSKDDNEQDVRPTDEEIIAHENSIRAAECQSMPLVGAREPLEALAAEYQDGSQVFTTKIHALSKQYTAVRRTRGDGNCFFRSFLFAHLESMAAGRNAAARQHLESRIQAAKGRLQAAGFQDLVFEDNFDIFVDLLQRLGAPVGPMELPQLEAKLRDPDTSNMLVVLLRFIVSAEVQLREEFFAPFVLGMSDDLLSVEQFCRRFVEPMGEESDHVHIVALTDALGVPIRVIYLDRSEGGEEDGAPNTHDFAPSESKEGGAGGGLPAVHVLYRPGHYDIIYPRQ